jgi:hypothetical protein
MTEPTTPSTASPADSAAKPLSGTKPESKHESKPARSLAAPAAFILALAALALGFLPHVSPQPVAVVPAPAQLMSVAPDLTPLLSRLEALEARPVGTSAAVPNEDMSSLRAEQQAAQDVAARLTSRVSELSAKLEALQAQLDNSGSSEAQLAVLAVTLQLMAAWQQGLPFQAQWQALLLAAPSSPELAGLAEDSATAILPWLEKGIPTTLKLAQGFAAVVRAELAASAPVGQNFSEKVLSKLQGLVVIRKQGETILASDATLDAQLQAAEQALWQGDVPTALAKLTAAPQSTELKEWLAQAQARAKVESLAQQLVLAAGKYVQPPAAESTDTAP